MTRSECLSGRNQSLAVTGVEVYELTDLGHRYLSRIEPSSGAAFDQRVSAGHDFGGLSPCHALNWRELDADPDEAWHRLVDFYARHSCETYSVLAGYRPFTAPSKVPACDPPPEEIVAAPVVVAQKPAAPRHTGAYVLGAVLGLLILVGLAWPKKARQGPLEGTQTSVLDMKSFPEDQLHR